MAVSDATDRSARPAAGARATTRLRTLSWPARGAILVALVVVAIGVWYALVDRSLASTDPRKHFAIVLDGYLNVREWNLLHPWETVRQPDYGPVTHYVGIAGALIAGAATPTSVLMPIVIVFLPLLVLGAYQAGRLVGGPWVGLGVVLFLLGAPIIVSQSHAIMVDVPLTAAVALCAWLLMASDRFSRRGYSIAAGAAIGFAFLIKNTAPIYLLGFCAVLLARGAWRQPVNLALAFVPFLVLALPWFLVHFGQQQELLQGSTTIADGSAADRQVWSVENFAWYGWAMLNFQLLLPLFTLFVAGLGVAAWRAVKRRALAPYTLECIASAAVAWVLCAVFLTQDMRYTMPALVFVGLIALGWTATASPRLRHGVVAVCAVAFAVNTAAVSFGLGSRVAVAGPGHNTSGVLERQAVLYSPEGYAGDGKPDPRSDFVGLFGALRDDGARRWSWEPETIFTNEVPQQLVEYFATTKGLAQAPLDELGPRDAMVVVHFPQPDEPPPCLITEDGRHLWVARGGEGPLTCPPGWTAPQ